MDAEIRRMVERLLSKDEIDDLSRQVEPPKISTGTKKTQLDVELSKEAQWKVLASFLMDVLKKRREALGAENENTLNIIHVLGNVYLQLREYEQAEDLYRQRFVIDEKLYGVDTSWAMMSNLGFVLNKQGRYAEAEGIQRRLLPLMQSGFKEDSPQVQMCKDDKRRKMFRDGLGRESPQALGCLRQMIESSAGHGKYEDARNLNAEGLEIVKSIRLDSPYRANELMEMEKMGEMINEMETLHEEQSVALKP